MPVIVLPDPGPPPWEAPAPTQDSIIGTNEERCEVVGVSVGGDPILVCDNEAGRV